MKPLLHAKSSVKKYGGVVEDYLPIHNFMDCSKSSVPDVRHRAVLHSSWGIYLAELFFGEYFQNAQGRDVSTRDIAEQHVIEDLGFIPTMEKWLEGMPIAPWMGGQRITRQVMDFTKEQD